MKKFLLLFLLCCFSFGLFAQDIILKKEYSQTELEQIKSILEEIDERDQMYRNFIANETLDLSVIQKIDSVFNHCGIQEGFMYRKALNLKLPEQVKDSLWQLQHINDIKNHMTLKGLLNTYGFIPEALIGDAYVTQMVLLLHPPTEWKIEDYHKNYAALLLPEVRAGRMTAKYYATFYDNMLVKIMNKPSLYGTGKHFDFKSKKELPAIINDVNQTNKARAEIGLVPLKLGEYRLSTSLD